MEIIILTFILIAVVVLLNSFKKPQSKNSSNTSNFSDEFDVHTHNNVDLSSDVYERDEYTYDFDGGDDD